MEKVAECCCGNSQIRVQGNPVVNAVCHCSSCKKRTGSAFGISVYFGEDDIVSEPESMSVFELDAASGPQQRYFCPSCGTTLYWRAAAFPNKVGIAGGCFTDGVAEPAFSVSNDGQVGWLQLSESCKQIET